MRAARALRADRAAGRVGAAFAERLMLSVTCVNGCRWCSFAHSRMAMSAGLGPDDVRGLLAGVVDGAPESELAALLYAQHWAETGGRPDPAVRARLVGTYGPAGAEAIERVIRTINTANLVGNTVDRVMGRLTRGRWASAIVLRTVVGAEAPS
jgi:AhpD family alkylhydroperoxidase